MKIILFLLFGTIALQFKVGAQNITTIAGGGTILTDGIPATSANFNPPGLGAFDEIGNYYFVHRDRVRMIDAMGIIHTVAGTTVAGFTGDGGPATAARLNYPYGIAFDKLGNMYIADNLNHRIRRVDGITHVITTVAGNGVPTYSGDGGPATAASLYYPTNVCTDTNRNVYLIDQLGARIRKIDTFGIINTFAGTGTPGYTGDGGLATAADIGVGPGMCIDPFENIYLAAGNNVRKINISTGVITTFAGNGTAAYVGDGIPATAAQFNAYELGSDGAGNIYIADNGNDRVYMIGTDLIFRLIAGNGAYGFSGDGGPATAAQLFNPEGAVGDKCGNVYIADAQNRRIRKVTFNATITPTISVTSVSSALIGSTVTVNVAVTGIGGTYSIKWFKNTSLFSTTAVPTTTYVKGAGTDIITARVVPASAYIACYDSVTSDGHNIVGVPVGIPPIPVGEFLIYPNPVGGVLVVSSAEVIERIVVTNIVGQIVRAHFSFAAKEVRVDVAHLPKGIYFIRVNDVYVQRFLKE